MAQAKHDSITRRAWLSGAAALVPAAAVPVAAAPLGAAPIPAPALPPPDIADPSSGHQPLPPPDPIFAAIEQHQCAYAALDAFVPELADVEQAA
jgi:hypothetical protein